MFKLYCRIYQFLFKIALYFMKWRKPSLIKGEHSVLELAVIIRKKGLNQVLVVTDAGIVSIGLMNGLLTGLEKEGINYTVYHQTSMNPTIDNIEDALKQYGENECDGIIAFGGGSPIDCAKGVGARIARPDKAISDMRGELKIRKAMPPFFAVPTTSGTGSEATLAAVISNNKTHEKYSILDHNLIPHYAVLDPMLTIKLPPHITAATGMDALTHVIEAYIGRSNTKETRQCSREAVKLIFNNLSEAYMDGTNIEARTNLQKAAYLAGMAFTRAYVGNVHAIAHTLGGFYNTPHGLANAIIMPYVLDYYGESAHAPLAELAEVIEIDCPGDSEEQKAQRFIKAIRQLNQDMNIPEKIGDIVASDIPVMVERAFQEANPLYPVPKILSKQDFTRLYEAIME